MWNQRCGKKFPFQVEITSPDLLMFRIGTEVEKEVEIGWYKQEKRKNEDISDLDPSEEEEDKRKRTKMENENCSKNKKKETLRQEREKREENGSN